MRSVREKAADCQERWWGVLRSRMAVLMSPLMALAGGTTRQRIDLPALFPTTDRSSSAL